jgi:MFS family permease
MTCEAYYTNHAEPAPGLDRCGNHEIEGGTARAVALLGASTTIFGVLNIFVTQWTMKKFGIKTALLISVFWPAVRLAIQNIGIEMGGSEGIIVVQSSQIITILGGPAGYLLALNSYVTEISVHGERTGVLGRLQGCSFIGTALAYLLGGLIAGKLGIIWPFRVTLGLFLTSCFYVALFLPWLPINKGTPSRAGISKFFGPLKTLTPSKWTLRSGKVKTENGAILLAIGAFLAVLATGYQSVLLQMYGTDVYHFGTTQNGYLISLNIFVRGIFLMFAFPRIISAGRGWFSRIKKTKDAAGNAPRESSVQQGGSEVVGPLDEEAEEEPLQPAKLNNEQETFDFDLQYTRYSLLVDGILTGSAMFISNGWQLFLIAGILPLAAGTGSSAKGVILQMCDPSERTDALSAITLVEMVARLATSKCMSVK